MFLIFVSIICIFRGCFLVRRGDVRSVWCGIRFFVLDFNKKDI